MCSKWRVSSSVLAAGVSSLSLLCHPILLARSWLYFLSSWTLPTFDSILHVFLWQSQSFRSCIIVFHPFWNQFLGIRFISFVLHVSVLPACGYQYRVGVWWPVEVRKGSRYPGTGVTGGCVPPRGARSGRANRALSPRGPDVICFDQYSREQDYLTFWCIVIQSTFRALRDNLKSTLDNCSVDSFCSPCRPFLLIW